MMQSKVSSGNGSASASPLHRPADARRCGELAGLEHRADDVCTLLELVLVE